MTIYSQTATQAQRATYWYHINWLKNHHHLLIEMKKHIDNNVQDKNQQLLSLKQRQVSNQSQIENKIKYDIMLLGKTYSYYNRIIHHMKMKNGDDGKAHIDEELLNFVSQVVDKIKYIVYTPLLPPYNYSNSRTLFEAKFLRQHRQLLANYRLSSLLIMEQDSMKQLLPKELPINELHQYQEFSSRNIEAIQTCDNSLINKLTLLVEIPDYIRELCASNNQTSDLVKYLIVIYHKYLSRTLIEPVLQIHKGKFTEAKQYVTSHYQLLKLLFPDIDSIRSAIRYITEKKKDIVDTHISFVVDTEYIVRHKIQRRLNKMKGLSNIQQQHVQYPNNQNQIRNPVKNVHCGHVYEYDNIHALLKCRSGASPCPCSNCTKTVEARSLYASQRLIRKYRKEELDLNEYDYEDD
jgi:hypothetical protein